MRERIPVDHRKPRVARVIEYTEEEIAHMSAELEARDAELQASYQKARQRRYDEQQAERETWRAERRAERQVEREAYLIECEERRCAEEAALPENVHWQKCLAYLAGQEVTW